MQQIDKKKLQKIVKILWILLHIIPISSFALFLIGQARSIDIDGKGDTGHPRSLSYPFICNSSSGFTDRGTLYYCDFDSFAKHGQSAVYYLARATKLPMYYLVFLAILIPVTGYAFYPKKERLNIPQSKLE